MCHMDDQNSATRHPPRLFLVRFSIPSFSSPLVEHLDYSLFCLIRWMMLLTKCCLLYWEAQESRFRWVWKLLDQEDFWWLQSVYQSYFPKIIFVLYLTRVNKSSSGYDEVPVLHTFRSEKQFVKFFSCFLPMMYLSCSLKIKTFI